MEPEEESPIDGYCVKYALTKGISPARVKRAAATPQYVVAPNARYTTLWRVGKEWVATREEAEAFVRKAALHKAELLRAQVLKLEQLAENPVFSDHAP